jgi:hypothetical protein
LRKPRNRRERMDMISQKYGYKTAQSLYFLTDKEVRMFFDQQYKRMLKMPDYVDSQPVCIRCNSEVEIEFHTYCSCGEDRAVYSIEDWKQDIKDNDKNTLEADNEFIANGYQLN